MPKADIELQRVLDFYESIGATRFIREAEALLGVPRTGRQAASSA